MTTSKSILIIDDDKRLRELLEDYLKEKKYKVYLCDDYSSALEILKFFLFDLAIVDRMMPSGDGIDLIKIIKEKNNTPVIMLTAMSESEYRIQGLQYGADDYLSKPFEPEELYLRIENLLTLYDNINQSGLRISFGNYIYDRKTNSLKKNNEELYLTEGENNLLLKLINKRNNILSREDLANEEFDESELRKVDVGITRLRQKIEKIPKQPQYIKTVRGKGYMLICKEI
jgi:two-component system phosphate regulon response regulator OmpR